MILLTAVWLLLPIFWIWDFGITWFNCSDCFILWKLVIWSNERGRRWQKRNWICFHSLLSHESKTDMMQNLCCETDSFVNFLKDLILWSSLLISHDDCHWLVWFDIKVWLLLTWLLYCMLLLGWDLTNFLFKSFWWLFGSSIFCLLYY